jgi:hypothetical protein
MLPRRHVWAETDLKFTISFDHVLLDVEILTQVHLVN